MIILSYGGGTNSKAVCVGMQERGERPDLILFADTGAERPETYADIDLMQIWLKSVGFPDITFVRYERETLEENCLRIQSLPSIAYGFKKCSLKFKRDPQDKFCNNNPDVKAAWDRGELVTKIIGYDADEPERASRLNGNHDKKYFYKYPLLEWDWGREECVEAIKRAGLSQPGKSSCFFCPSMKQQEILELKRLHPDLLDRALKIEDQAQLTSVKGLGRNFAWRDLIEFDDKQCKLFPESYIRIDCGCYDGD